MATSKGVYILSAVGGIVALAGSWMLGYRNGKKVGQNEAAERPAPTPQPQAEATPRAARKARRKQARQDRKASGIRVMEEQSKPAKQQRPAPAKGDAFPLRLGSVGPRVKRLQIWLHRNFAFPIRKAGHDAFDKVVEQEVRKRLKVREIDEATYRHFGMDKPVHEQKTVR